MTSDEDRYLTINRGTYAMKLMVYRDPIRKGERVQIHLSTTDKQEAREKRDLVLKALHTAGVISDKQAQRQWCRKIVN